MTISQFTSDKLVRKISYLPYSIIKKFTHFIQHCTYIDIGGIPGPTGPILFGGGPRIPP